MVLDVIRALGRRWYVVLIGAIATAALTVGAYVTTPPEYNARGLVLLLPAPSVVGEGGNPLLNLGGLEQPAGILVAYFSSAPAREEVKAQSETAQYVVGIDDSTRGPVIVVDVTDADPQTTLDVLNHIIDRIPEQLDALQDQVDAPADSVISSTPLTVDEKADRDMGGTIRMVIAALVVGVAVTCITAFALDGILRRRRLRRTGWVDEPPRARRRQQPVESRADDDDEPTADPDDESDAVPESLTVGSRP